MNLTTTPSESALSVLAAQTGLSLDVIHQLNATAGLKQILDPTVPEHCLVYECQLRKPSMKLSLTSLSTLEYLGSVRAPWFVNSTQETTKARVAKFLDGLPNQNLSQEDSAPTPSA